MAAILNRLIGEEVDAYKSIYDLQLSQLKTGVSVSASSLISNSIGYNYYRMLDTMGHFAHYNLHHDSHGDRHHFAEVAFEELSPRKKLRIPIFYTEKVKIEYTFKKETIVLFEDLVIKGFKSSAKIFLDLLIKNNNKGKVKITLMECSSLRKDFETKFFEEDLDIIKPLEEDAKRNLTEFLVDPSYKDGLNRLKLFYPDLSVKDFSKMDKEELKQKISLINLKSMGIKTVDAYIYFIGFFSKYYITNAQLMKKTNQIDNFLTKYLDK